MLIGTLVSVKNHKQCDNETSSAFMNRDRQIVPNLGIHFEIPF